MGRPTIFDRPMTGAERQARHREKRRRERLATRTAGDAPHWTDGLLDIGELYPWTAAQQAWLDSIPIFVFPDPPTPNSDDA